MKAISKLLLATILVASATYAQAQQSYGANFDETDYGKFYLRIGASFLSDGFAKKMNRNELEDMFSTPTGLNFEMGKYFFLHSEPVVDLFKVGIDATFLSVGYNPLKVQYSDMLDEVEKSDLTSLAAKIGPVISFNPLENIFVDAFVKVAPTVLTTLTDFDGMDGVRFAWKSDVGVNLRYKKLTLTAAYESGSFKFDEIYVEGEDYENAEIKQEKYPMGIFQVKLGLQFY